MNIYKYTYVCIYTYLFTCIYLPSQTMFQGWKMAEQCVVFVILLLELCCRGLVHAHRCVHNMQDPHDCCTCGHCHQHHRFTSYHGDVPTVAQPAHPQLHAADMRLLHCKLQVWTPEWVLPRG